ncbi:MAG: hypothetical protein PHS54_03410 [Clostridia bacterium]|jgi:thermostable 8-oxoguanine DNA glycosylase|nr:hypothetical protein [Clostridia bacterium]
MENLTFYKKYYLIEKYLFDEVSKNFYNRHFLTKEEFFVIIIWKSNRSKTKVLDGIKSTNKTIKQISEQIFNTKDRKNKIEILQKIDGIGLPIASAILTVCFPNEFTITDYRATRTLKTIKKGKNIKNPSSSIDNYLNYVDICIDEAKSKNISLRELDRFLWGYDFYEGEDGLKDLVRGIK